MAKVDLKDRGKRIDTIAVHELLERSGCRMPALAKYDDGMHGPCLLRNVLEFVMSVLWRKPGEIEREDGRWIERDGRVCAGRKCVGREGGEERNKGGELFTLSQIDCR